MANNDKSSHFEGVPKHHFSSQRAIAVPKPLASQLDDKRGRAKDG